MAAHALIVFSGTHHNAMTQIRDLTSYFNEYLQKRSLTKEPAGLYEPVNYIMNLGGKRIRPLMLLLANELYGGKMDDALPAAYAVEMFHNFTLVHDDIMDEADLRRGKATIHKKYGNNAAILSGDVMLLYVYHVLAELPDDKMPDLLKCFNAAAIKVCEGQQYDMDFETRQDVSVADYLTMIEYKTAVLLAASLQMGGILANASTEEQHKLYQLGINMGLAFQIQDDYLDTFGDPTTFGKTIGGDIRQNKKTYLLNMTRQIASGADATELEHMLFAQADEELKVATVTKLYRKLGVDVMAQDKQSEYFEQCLSLIKSMNVSTKGKSDLMQFTDALFSRTT